LNVKQLELELGGGFLRNERATKSEHACAYTLADCALHIQRRGLLRFVDGALGVSIAAKCDVT